jgi:hypothetical protein
MRDEALALGQEIVNRHEQLRQLDAQIATKTTAAGTDGGVRGRPHYDEWPNRVWANAEPHNVQDGKGTILRDGWADNVLRNFGFEPDDSQTYSGGQWWQRRHPHPVASDPDSWPDKVYYADERVYGVNDHDGKADGGIALNVSEGTLRNAGYRRDPDARAGRIWLRGPKAARLIDPHDHNTWPDEVQLHGDEVHERGGGCIRASVTPDDLSDYGYDRDEGVGTGGWSRPGWPRKVYVRHYRSDQDGWVVDIRDGKVIVLAKRDGRPAVRGYVRATHDTTYREAEGQRGYSFQVWVLPGDAGGTAPAAGDQGVGSAAGG